MVIIWRQSCVNYQLPNVKKLQCHVLKAEFRVFIGLLSNINQVVLYSTRGVLIKQCFCSEIFGLVFSLVRRSQPVGFMLWSLLFLPINHIRKQADSTVFVFIHTAEIYPQAGHPQRVEVGMLIFLTHPYLTMCICSVCHSQVLVI